MSFNGGLGFELEDGGDVHLSTTQKFLELIFEDDQKNKTMRVRGYKACMCINEALSLSLSLTHSHTLSLFLGLLSF